MALKHCTMAEMASLSGPFCTPGHRERMALSRVPAAAALLPELDKAHADLLATYWASMDGQKAAAELSQEEHDVDFAHDSFIRAVYYVLQGHIHLQLASTGNSELVKVLENLHARLYPTGLQIVQASYREEAGHGALLAARLTTEEKALLARIPVLGGSLLDQVNAWIRYAERLGELEDIRDSVAARGRPSAADAQRARNRWIRTVNAMLAVLDLVSIDDAELLAIIERVHEVARQAELRTLGSAPSDTDPPADEPTPAPSIS